MDVRLSLFGDLTQELRRPPGRAPDLGSISLSLKETIRTVNRLALAVGRQAPLVWFRSMATRSFRSIPDEALPKALEVRLIGLPRGRRRLAGRTSRRSTRWNWQARNPWFGDERLHISCTGRFFTESAVFTGDGDGGAYRVWRGDGQSLSISNLPVPEVDIEAAVRTDPNANIAVFSADDVEGYADVNTFMERFYSSRMMRRNMRAPKEGVAMEFLRRHLSVEQRLELLTKKYFTVVGSEGGVFHVHSDPGGWSVDEVEQGRVIASWCIVPGPMTVQAGAEVVIQNENFDEEWPVGDILLARKLIIETDEARFREIANRDLKVAEAANRKPLMEMARLALLMIEHATDHEWWNAILRSLKAKHPPIEAVYA